MNEPDWAAVEAGAMPFAVLLDALEEAGEPFDPRWRSDDPVSVRDRLDACREPDPACLRWYAWWWRDRGGLWRRTNTGRAMRAFDVVPGLLWLAEHGRWPLVGYRGDRWTFWDTNATTEATHFLPPYVALELRNVVTRNDDVEWYARSLHAALETAALAVATTRVEGLPSRGFQRIVQPN